MCPEQISQRVFDAFRAIHTFAIDTHRPLDENEFLSELGLNENTFQEELYVERQAKEDELKAAIEHFSDVVVVSGPAGCGKTSAATRVLNSFRESRKDMVFIIDFKRLLEPVNGIQTEGPVPDSLEAAQAFVDGRVRAELFRYMEGSESRPRISRDAVAEVFLRDQVRFQYTLNEKSAPIRADIIDRWSEEQSTDAGEVSRIEWYRRALLEGGYVAKAALDLFASLNTGEMLFGLTRCAELTGDLKAILLLDNTDSITNITFRQNLYSALRSLQPRVSDCARVVLVTRPKGLPKKFRADKDAHQVRGVDFASGDKADQETDRMIVEKRRLFLSSKSESLGTKAVGMIDGWCRALNGNKRLRRTISDISNGNRRIRGVCETTFAEDMLMRSPAVNLNDLDAVNQERSYPLESLFYGWLTRAGKSVLDVQCYNIVASVKGWEEQPSELACLPQHLVLAAVHNLSEQLGRVPVHATLDILEEVGLGEKECRRILFDLFGGPDEDRGLLEFSRSHLIGSMKDIRTDDEVALTRRSRHILLVLSNKLAFLQALLRRDSGGPRQRRFTELTFDSVNEVFTFMTQLARMHLFGLEFIQKQLLPKHGEDWLNYYRTHFCLDLHSGSAFSDGRGNVLFDNMIGSHIKFLRNQSERRTEAIHGEGKIQRAIKAFEGLRDWFNAEVLAMPRSTAGRDTNGGANYRFRIEPWSERK